MFADISRFKELERATELARTREAFLAAAGTALLSASLDLTETLERVTRLAVPEVADFCAIEIPGDGLESIAHRDPQKVAYAKEMRRRYPPDPHLSVGVMHVIRTGVPELHEEITDAMLVAGARDDEHLRFMRELGMCSVMIVPLMDGERGIGAITFVSSNPARRYSAADLEMAKRLAQKAGIAVQNARLFRAEQQARATIERAAERMTRLATITDELARALTTDAVALVVVDNSAAAVGAATAGMWRLDEEGRDAQLVRAWNYTDSARKRFETIPVNGTAPLADAMRRREAVYIGSEQEYERRYPDSALRVKQAGTGPMTSVACLPLTLGRQVIGALAFSFPLGTHLDADEQAFLKVVAGHCAQALYRARLYEAEQRARYEMALLYELVDSVGRAATLDEVFEPALNALKQATGADRTSVLLFDADGVMRFEAWHGLSDAYRAAVEGHSPWTRDDAAPAPILVPDVETDPSLAAYLPVFRAEQIRALAFVPLVHQHTLLGKFMLYCREPRSFSPEQVALARSMGAQVAHAVVRKRAEAQIAGLLADADIARAEAEQASRMKDEFLAVVSHELRTPMSAILGWSAILATPRRSDPETLEKGLTVIERNARGQMRIIEDILDVSRIITGKLVIDPKPVSLVQITSEALDVVRASAQAKEIALELDVPDEPHTVVGDPERLRQIIWNLLSNAIKFTPPGGRVCTRIRRDLNVVSLEVSDTGAGIAPEFLPHVFERFRQADGSTTRSQTGLGLGLAIVRHLVELHGGQVRASSPGEGQGATFTVTLPVRALFAPSEQRTNTGTYRMPPRGTPSEGTARILSGVKVLVVDDEADARELLEEVLELYGAQVCSAGSAADALERVLDFAPDVLVSDVGMPGEDGYSLIARVRALPRATHEISAIALTAYARPDDKRRALAAGFDAHLPKPTDPDTLVRLIVRMRQQVA